jgi:hypothetical protein
VDELFIVTQPAHLQKQFSDKLSAEERDLLVRADMLRDRFETCQPAKRKKGRVGIGQTCKFIAQ